ncbi:MAG: hypothetical protein ABFS19_07650 [Thermodesulfobacteriota bacterium]
MAVVSEIKKIFRIYTTSTWVPFLLVAFFLLITNILVVSGGVWGDSILNYSTLVFIKLYAWSLLGQIYVSFWHFFHETKTGTIQLLLLAASLLFSFLSFFFVLVPFWRGLIGV